MGRKYFVCCCFTTFIPISVSYLSKTVCVPNPFGTSLTNVSTKRFFNESIPFHGIVESCSKSFHIVLNSVVPGLGK